jgi:hypothetical protein
MFYMPKICDMGQRALLSLHGRLAEDSFALQAYCKSFFFRRSNTRRQCLSRHKTPEIPVERSGKNLAESKVFHTCFRDLLHAAYMRHGTDGFTSPPKEGVLRIFSP